MNTKYTKGLMAIDEKRFLFGLDEFPTITIVVEEDSEDLAQRELDPFLFSILTEVEEECDNSDEVERVPFFVISKSPRAV